MAQRKGISSGTTAQRTIEEAGKIRFNTTTNLLEYYDGQTWKVVDSPPTISSIDVTDVDSAAGGNQTFVITGSGFSTTITEVRFVANSGSDVIASSVTRDSATQVTAVAAKSSFANANEPYDIKVTNSSGLAGVLANQVNVDSAPIWQTAAGSIATIYDGGRSSFSVEVSAHDSDSDAITYTVQSGSLPAGLSLTSANSGAVISGNATAVGSNTTSTFTLRAAANSKTTDRQYTITVNAPVSTSFTSSGTFSVPSGISAVDVLVVAGGGGGANHHGGGGGAGGLIYRPGFTVTPGGNVSVTVGDGAATLNNYPAPDNPQGSLGNDGQNSVFGTLTAIGGGGGGFWGSENGRPGGSGGGMGGPGPGSQGENATQPNQSGDSGNYGFGNKGGGASGDDMGGGGGAGGDGSNGGGGGGPGGVGRAYTIADGTTSVYYAGGGGGSRYPSNGQGGTGGQGGGGDGGIENEPDPSSMVGTANRGGGGGGADRGPGASGAGAAGGKGIVIVRY
jgi:hypothetical protein